MPPEKVQRIWVDLSKASTDVRTLRPEEIIVERVHDEETAERLQREWDEAHPDQPL